MHARVRSKVSKKFSKTPHTESFLEVLLLVVLGAKLVDALHKVLLLGAAVALLSPVLEDLLQLLHLHLLQAVPVDRLGLGRSLGRGLLLDALACRVVRKRECGG